MWFCFLPRVFVNGCINPSKINQTHKAFCIILIHPLQLWPTYIEGSPLSNYVFYRLRFYVHNVRGKVCTLYMHVRALVVPQCTFVWHWRNQICKEHLKTVVRYMLFNVISHILTLIWVWSLNDNRRFLYSF